MKKFILFLLLNFIPLLAQNTEQANVAEEPKIEIQKDSTTEKENDSGEILLKELAQRDSLMALQNTACAVEKDSLRKTIETEKSKSENWEKSYDTMKKNNEVCARALSISLETNEKAKEKEEMSKQQAAMMTSTSFLGGLSLGALLFWLIFD